jgi:hypothetical protein
MPFCKCSDCVRAIGIEKLNSAFAIIDRIAYEEVEVSAIWTYYLTTNYSFQSENLKSVCSAYERLVIFAPVKVNVERTFQALDIISDIRTKLSTMGYVMPTVPSL